MQRRSFLALPLAAAASPRPNFVQVLVDDLRFDELGCTGHPFARTPHCDRLARQGTTFTNAFATTPLCSPSRASFLTGQYAHTHGILDNVARDALSHRLLTWPRLLHEGGYETAILGKWHMGNDDSARPGFDRWVSFRGQGECIDPELNIDGRSVKSTGYITDILTDHAVEFLDRRRQKPFCVYLAHKAVHPNVQQRDDGSVDRFGIAGAEAFIPAERHRRLYADERISRRQNYARPPMDKPALERRIDGVAPLGPNTATDDETIRNRMRMTKAVDEGLGRILEILIKNGQLNNTMIIFTSDHGYFYGEHCLNAERRLAYEETIRIPLLVRYPRLFPARSRRSQLTLSTDIAATVLELAGVRSRQPIHGRSLLAKDRREGVLIEYFSDTVYPRIHKMGYQCVRTDRWKYIHYLELAEADELYDLGNDPYELKNLVRDPAAPLAEMKARLNRLLGEAGA